MPEKLRLGLIGAGGIAVSRHIPGLLALKQAGLDTCVIAAVCDNVLDNANRAADQIQAGFGNRPRVYTDWQEALQKAPVDAVDVCLPHGLHHVVGIAALESGLHVIMEKPYTVTVRTGTRLAEAADRAGKILATAVPHRRMPGQRAVHWAINEAKLIGQPRMFLSEYTQFRAPNPNAPVRPAMMWRRDRLMGGGYGVIDSGFHFLDTIRYFYGEVEQVYAELRAHKPDAPANRREDVIDEREDTAVVVFRFKNGVVGTWVWSFAVPGRETRNIMIYGSEGSIEDTGYSNLFVIHHMFMGPGELRRRDGAYYSMEQLQGQMRHAIGPERLQRTFPNGVTDHFAIELWDFIDAVLNDGKPEVDGWGGLGTTALVEAIYESALSGKAVSIADVLSGKAYYGWQTAIDEYWDSQPIPKLARG